MPDLKPCPFCGGAAAFRWCGGVLLAECTGCHASKGDDGGEDFHQQAADNWNRRASLPEVVTPKMRAEDQDAAYAYRESLVPRADHLHAGQFPMWHGWAIYEAYIAGIAWARRSPQLAKEEK